MDCFSNNESLTFCWVYHTKFWDFSQLSIATESETGFHFWQSSFILDISIILKERYLLLFSKIKSITPSAQNVPLSGLPDNISQVSAPQPWYLICRSGRRSLRAARILRKAGYQVINVSGGMLSWQGPVTR